MKTTHETSAFQSRIAHGLHDIRMRKEAMARIEAQVAAPVRAALVQAIGNLTERQAVTIYSALAQWVEQGEDAASCQDETTEAERETVATVYGVVAAAECALAALEETPEEPTDDPDSERTERADHDLEAAKDRRTL
jgi:uncharacterized protein YgiB involved in biofilm formation